MGKVDISDRFIPPTVILNPNMESELMQEEIFAPILPIVSFTNFNTVLNLIKNSKKTLSMYYCGDDSSRNF